MRVRGHSHVNHHECVCVCVCVCVCDFSLCWGRFVRVGKRTLVQVLKMSEASVFIVCCVSAGWITVSVYLSEYV